MRKASIGGFTLLLLVSLSCGRFDPFGHHYIRKDVTSGLPYDQCLYQGLAGNSPDACSPPAKEYCEANHYLYDSGKMVCLSEGYCLGEQKKLNTGTGVCE